jgi:hypothetical protein
MGLANETIPNTATIADYIATVDEIRARNLASRLVSYEHNPYPGEAQNPAHGVHIRKIVPYRVHVDKSAQDHNLAVQTLGQQGAYTR